MDLRNIMNIETVDTSTQRQTTPITPVQAVAPQHSFRDFQNPPPHPPARYASQDHGRTGSTTEVSSPTTYAKVYQGRLPAPPPPPLQPLSHNDVRSPAAAAASSSHYVAPSPSPFGRSTPSSSSVGGGQYPNPPNHQNPQNPQSPAQPHPHASPLQHRDSYVQPHGHPPPPPPPPSHQPHPHPYGQPHSVPNTPPVGTPSSANPHFQHQRSQSSHSTSTPTSAQSQQQFFNQHPVESPVSMGSFPHTQLPQHQRQDSQPRTPLGPPPPTQRQVSGGYPQPPSPYQQRPASSGLIHQQHSAQQNSPGTSVQSQPRLSNTPSLHNSRQTSVADSLPRTLSARDASLSVSPKTQPPSIPRADMAPLHPQPLQNGEVSTPKRKISEREEPGSASATHTANGRQTIHPPIVPTTLQRPRKRIRYSEPPVWARSITGRVKNATLLPDTKRHIKIETPNGHQYLAHVPRRMPENTPQEDLPLGPWERSIAGNRPYEEISKRVADWLFFNVVARPDAGELASLGIEVEIEAKLGQLINKDTNDRLRLPVQTECLLTDNARVSFKSSMTEAQHKFLNGFLNSKVSETHPENPNRTKPRVPILYTHRRERDSFYELPPSEQVSLPACIRNKLNPRHTVKVRVTHDTATNQLLAKIIKARVADIDLYNPLFPLDCRISINLEMRYDGDLTALTDYATRLPDRNKDRLSYTQSHYQIDLTQVTVADASRHKAQEHELEIELSSAAVREQGRLVKAGEPHQYDELIEGFMDNIRLLYREVPDHSATLG